MEYITEFSIESFTDALTECFRYKHNKIIILFNDDETFGKFSEAINEIRDSMPDVRRCMATSNDMIILFGNGSVIHAYAHITETTLRSVRCHRVLYDPYIDIDQYRYIIEKMLVKRTYLDPNDVTANAIYDCMKDIIPQYTDDSPELDEFLDGFKIIDNT